MPGDTGGAPPWVELNAVPTRRDYEPLEGASPEDCAIDLSLGESYEIEAVPNLDSFFARIYRYYVEKGFVVMVTTRLLSIAALAFTIVFSATLLLAVDWDALHLPCIIERKCDIMDVAFLERPLRDHAVWWTTTTLAYLGLLCLYWLWSLLHLVEDIRDACEMRHFYQNKLGISDRSVATTTWPEVLQRIVLLQQHIRLCVVRDLSAHDICARIMRKDNFLIGMINKGVLALNIPVPGLRRRVLLTKIMEWNLRYCLLDPMFDKNFQIRPSFKHDPEQLRRRFRVLAAINLLVSPFLMAFLLIYFFMRNAEKFYHHPSLVAARNWSPYATWRLREFNEMVHLVDERLAFSQDAASKYISQFPTPIVRQVAKFVAFISGSFAALILFLAVVNDVLMERHFAGHNLVYWGACLGVLLAVSRSLIGEGAPMFDPEDAMAKVARYTHFMPRHWRGRSHTREVQEQFERMYCYKALLFVEELSSVFLAPYILGVSLPHCADAICGFIRHSTTHVPGLGDVCSLAQFDFERHGSRRYGGPDNVPRDHRSHQGKMEKSFLSFVTTYQFWEPPEQLQRNMLESLSVHVSPAQDGGVQADVAESSHEAARPLWSRTDIITRGGMRLPSRLAVAQAALQTMYMHADMVGTMENGLEDPRVSRTYPLKSPRL
eukprot:jgi/Tetstr1/445573/TSEL_033346.t1